MTSTTHGRHAEVWFLGRRHDTTIMHTAQWRSQHWTTEDSALQTSEGHFFPNRATTRFFWGGGGMGIEVIVNRGITVVFRLNCPRMRSHICIAINFGHGVPKTPVGSSQRSLSPSTIIAINWSRGERSHTIPFLHVTDLDFYCLIDLPVVVRAPLRPTSIT